MRNKMFKTAVATLLMLGCVCQAEADVKLDVLAKDGAAKATQQWPTTGEYLTEKIGQPVEIVPLGFDKGFPAVEAGEANFFPFRSAKELILSL